jgi:hypothetical protein
MFAKRLVPCPKVGFWVSQVDRLNKASKTVQFRENSHGKTVLLEA